MVWNRESQKPPNNAAARYAPRLRRRMTDAEKRLWKALRCELPEIPGTHFRRQMAIGPYVADFVCLRARLVIEVDGEVHQDKDQRKRDIERDTFLRGQRFNVLRLGNRDVMLDMPLVLTKVSAALAAAPPTPNPSPHGGGEQAVHP